MVLDCPLVTNRILCLKRERGNLSGIEKERKKISVHEMRKHKPLPKTTKSLLTKDVSIGNSQESSTSAKKGGTDLKWKDPGPSSNETEATVPNVRYSEKKKEGST